MVERRLADRRNELQDRLDSWKEIAAHMGRTVRTVQRWERDLGLPVHRVAGLKRDMVSASAHELDAWAAGRGSYAVTQRETDSGEVPLPRGEEETAPPPEAYPPNANPQIPTNGNGHGNPEKLPQDSAIAPGTLRGAPAPHTSARWQRRAAAAIALMALGALGVVAMRIPISKARAWFSPPAPERYEIAGNELRLFDARGSFVWKHEFPARLESSAYEWVKTTTEPQYIELADLDGDGRKEVLFIVRSEPSVYHATFTVFNSDGSVRFTRRRASPVVFGKQEYPPPFIPRGFLVTSEPNGKKSIWLTTPQQPDFPEVLEKLNDRGESLGEFWHGGHLHALRESTYQGKRVILAGYVENDRRRASMAVLDYDNPTGYAPAENSYYECSSCPPGRPLEFFIFPRSELAAALNSMPLVSMFLVSEKAIQVVVSQTTKHNLPDNGASQAIYKLDSDLNFMDAGYSVDHEELHARLKIQGALDHSYRRMEELQLFPVLRWDGSRFVSIPMPEGFAAARRAMESQKVSTSSRNKSVPAGKEPAPPRPIARR